MVFIFYYFMSLNNYLIMLRNHSVLVKVRIDELQVNLKSQFGTANAPASLQLHKNENI